MSKIWVLTPEEKNTVSSLITKGKKEQEQNEKFALIAFDSFYNLFNTDELAIIKKYLSIDPKELNYKLPLLGYANTFPSIVSIPNQPYKLDGKNIPCQYLPEEAFRAYEKLNAAMQKELGKKVGVLYGYRSPARQVFIFFDILERKYNYDFDKTVQRVCFPAYSEHVCIQRQAIDFITQEGICEGFENTEEYKWLKNNAQQFGFFESYSKDNSLGMMYEPWHWHYKAQ